MDKLFCIDPLRESFKVLGLDRDSLEILGEDFTETPVYALTPPCINSILSMRHPEAPNPEQNFYLACYLLEAGFDIDVCKRVFKTIFRDKYVDEVADTQLKLIKLKGYEPYDCMIVDKFLGLCNGECEFCSSCDAGRDAGIHLEYPEAHARERPVPEPFIQKRPEPVERMR